MMRRWLIGTGWKMNNNAAQARAYGQAMRGLLKDVDLEGIDLFVLPPFTTLHAAREAFAGSPIAYGAQNVHWESEGAFTGEISAPMLVEAGCRYVEVGHAERFANFGETYQRVGLKVRAALAAGLTPIVCLGESAREREHADGALAEQLRTVLTGLREPTLANVVLAYEPRWAIGAAEPAPVSWVAARHAHLRNTLAAAFGGRIADQVPILYGGAVSAANARRLLAPDDVDGLFVGRAAWKAEGFAEIVRIGVAQRRERIAAAQRISRRSA